MTKGRSRESAPQGAGRLAEARSGRCRLGAGRRDEGDHAAHDARWSREAHRRGSRRAARRVLPLRAGVGPFRRREAELVRRDRGRRPTAGPRQQERGGHAPRRGEGRLRRLQGRARDGHECRCRERHAVGARGRARSTGDRGPRRRHGAAPAAGDDGDAPVAHQRGRVRGRARAPPTAGPAQTGCPRRRRPRLLPADRPARRSAPAGGPAAAAGPRGGGRWARPADPDEVLERLPAIAVKDVTEGRRDRDPRSPADHRRRGARDQGGRVDDAAMPAGNGRGGRGTGGMGMGGADAFSDVLGMAGAGETSW